MFETRVLRECGKLMTVERRSIVGFQRHRNTLSSAGMTLFALVEWTIHLIERVHRSVHLLPGTHSQVSLTCAGVPDAMKVY